MDLEQRTRTMNAVLVIVGFAAARRIPLKALLEGTGLRPAQLSKPTANIRFYQEFRLIRNLQKICPDVPSLGFQVGQGYVFTTLAAVGFAVVSSANLRGAFDVVFRYSELNPSLIRIKIETSGDDLAIALLDDELPADVRQFAVERSVAVALTLAHQLLGRRIVPLALDFVASRPRTTAEYRRVAGIAPHFGASTNRLVIRKADADTPMLQANPVALHMAEDYCRQLLKTPRRSGYSAQVLEMLCKQPRSVPSMADIATRLHLSVRNLHRRLADEGTRYQHLCDEARCAVAQELLAVPRMPIDQVAERVGYSEAAAFIRAFNRWTGMTPTAYRRSLR